MLRTKVWDAQTGKVKLILQGEDGECRCIAWSPDGHRIATANFQTYRGADGLYTAKIWNAVTGEEFLSLSALHKGRFLSVAWSPDGSLMATGMEAGTTQVWDAETGKSLLTLSGNKEIVTSVVWSPDGKFIATVSGVNTAAVWNAETGNRLFTLRGHNRPVRSVAWSPNGKRLATGSLDGTAKVWDVEMDS
jgi:WD40 repeat protein